MVTCCVARAELLSSSVAVHLTSVVPSANRVGASLPTSRLASQASLVVGGQAGIFWRCYSDRESLDIEGLQDFDLDHGQSVTIITTRYVEANVLLKGAQKRAKESGAGGVEGQVTATVEM